MENRITWVDNIKGLLLLFTCSSHFVKRPWIISQILDPTPTYYVPLFIFMSGYLCKPRNEGLSVWEGQKMLIYRRFRVLVIPYFFFSLLGLISGIASGEEAQSMLIQMLYYGSGCHAATPTYFFTLLFVTSLAFTWVTWNIKLRRILSLSLIICGLVFVWLLTKDLSLQLPWHLKNLPFYGAFFLSGYTIRTFEKEKLADYKRDALEEGIIALLLLILGFGGMFLSITGTVLSIICPVSLMAGVILLINVCSQAWRVLNIRMHFLHFMSINGVAVLGAHVFIYGIILSLLRDISLEINEWIWFAFCFVVTYGLLYFVIVPFMNRYLYMVLGKVKE